MSEINLLPDELRGKEEKEIKLTGKKSASVDVAMSDPAKEPKIKGVKQKSSRPSLLSRLFAEPKKEATSMPQLTTAEKITDSDQAFHIPERQIKSGAGANLEMSQKSIKKDQPKKDKRKLNIDILGFFKKKTKKLVNLNADALDVNLIPKDLIKYPEVELPKIYVRSGSVIFITFLVVIAGYLGITFYQINISRQIKNLEISIASLDEQINSFDTDKQNAVRLQRRIELVRGLLDKHIYWTKFFGLLEKNTIKDVYYTNFSMAGQEKLIISAVGKDYTAVAQQLVAFEEANDFIKSAQVDGAAAQIDQDNERLIGVGFNITLEFVPNIFLKPIK